MTKVEYGALTPQRYIHRLFEDTHDGVVKVPYGMDDQTNGEEGDGYHLTYELDWTQEDVAPLVTEYETLVAHLDRIAARHIEVWISKDRAQLLSPEELTVWQTYLEPLTGFRVAEEDIYDLHVRGKYDQLEEDEHDLLEEHYAWAEDQCRLRLPELRYSPLELIKSAWMYEILAGNRVEPARLRAAAMDLAREMVLSHHAVRQIYKDILGLNKQAETV